MLSNYKSIIAGNLKLGGSYCMDKIIVAPIFKDHMIIQRQKVVYIWGEGPENALVTVRFAGQVVTDIVKNHKWKCELSPVEPGVGLDMTISTDIPKFPVKIIKDIAVGDIWLAGGQSNMEYFLKYDEHWNEIRNQKKNSNIRMYNVPRLSFEGQQKDVSDSGYWFEEGDLAWERFSAPGYTFARALQPHIQIPIGVIGCNWGGTPACAWVDESVLTGDLRIFLDEYEQEVSQYTHNDLREASLKGFAHEDSASHQQDFEPLMYGLSLDEQRVWMNEHEQDPVIPMGPYHMYRPGGLFHQMLEPLIPFAIKGVLWYQGESDSGHASLYDQMMEKVIRSWRGLWKDDFPFLYVQLAPFGKWLDCTNEGFAEIRQKQDKVSKTVKDAYMISIMDLGMYEDIHPKRKREVGERLALLARGKVYKEDILCSSPEPESILVDKNKVCIKFSNVGMRLYDQGNILANISIVHDGQVEIPCISKIEVDTLVLECKRELNGVIEVHFADSDYAEVNVYNQAGLPVKPFVVTIEL